MSHLKKLTLHVFKSQFGQCESKIPSFVSRVNAALSLQLLLKAHALSSLFNVMGWVGGKRGWGRARIKSVGVRRKEGRKRWFLYNLWVGADWGSCREVLQEGGWMDGGYTGRVNAEFNLKYLERAAEELRDRWRVETEEETDWLSLRSQLQIDGVRDEVFGGGTRSESLHYRGAKPPTIHSSPCIPRTTGNTECPFIRCVPLGRRRDHTQDRSPASADRCARKTGAHTRQIPANRRISIGRDPDLSKFTKDVKTFRRLNSLHSSEAESAFR